jgi:hypothetical protein
VNTTFLIVEASEISTDMNNSTVPFLIGFVEITLTSEHCFALTRYAAPSIIYPSLD